MNNFAVLNLTMLEEMEKFFENHNGKIPWKIVTTKSQKQEEADNLNSPIIIKKIEFII